MCAFVIEANAAEQFKLSEVITCDSLADKEIFSMIREWSATNLVNAKVGTQVMDSESMFISFNLTSEYTYGTMTMKSYEGWYHYTVTVKCKDGRFKVEMSNLVHENKPGFYEKSKLGLIYEGDENLEKSTQKGPDRKVVEDIKEKAKKTFTGITESMKKFAEDYKKEEDEDW